MKCRGQAQNSGIRGAWAQILVPSPVHKGTLNKDPSHPQLLHPHRGGETFYLGYLDRHVSAQQPGFALGFLCEWTPPGGTGRPEALFPSSPGASAVKCQSEGGEGATTLQETDSLPSS